MMMMQRNFTITTSELYDLVEFKTSSTYNLPPPPPSFTFLLGIGLSVASFGLWIRRVQTIRNDLGLTSLTGGGTLRLRTWLTAYIDNDCPVFTCIRVAAQSFLFLGGLQLNYQWAFLGILGFFALESSCDSLRVLLSYHEANTIQDIVVTSKFLRSDLRQHPLTTTLQPNNVYEDLTRSSFVVGMVFVTQVLMIVFVVLDMFSSETHYCLDGTAECPVTGTLGSWVFYVLGIFMACVYLVGPKTKFGRSEQNAAYWLQLLLSAKQSPTYTWYDSVDAETKTLKLQKSDWQQWIRFMMSFLINGVGFHILVHALPIQIAGQSSLTGVVFRAVGMMYLVDLDDTSGYTMTVVPTNDDDDDTTLSKDDSTTDPADDSSVASTALYRFFSGGRDGQDDAPVAAQKIIAKAQAQLDALKSRTKKRKSTRHKQKKKSWKPVSIHTTLNTSQAEF